LNLDLAKRDRESTFSSFNENDDEAASCQMLAMHRLARSLESQGRSLLEGPSLPFRRCRRRADHRRRVEKKQCSKHQKPSKTEREESTLGEAMQMLKQQVAEARRDFKAGKGRSCKVVLDLSLPLPVRFFLFFPSKRAESRLQHLPESTTSAEAVEEYKPWCSSVVQAIFRVTRWQFQFVLLLCSLRERES
jgi:hypothetical protein